MTDVEVTEFEMIDPDELHLVGTGANGFKALLAKSATEEVRGVLETISEIVDAEIVKAEDRPACETCDGSGKVDDAKCKTCMGSGVKPRPGDTQKSLEQLAKIKEHGVAASSQPSAHATDCPTCKGTGSVPYGGKDQSDCPDCDGTGKDSTAPPADKLARVDGDGHKIHVGDAKGREKVDKALDDSVCDDDECEVCKEVFGDDLLEKKKLNAAARNSLPDSAFALPGRRYPIHDENHARNALARVAQHGTPEEQAKVKAAVHRKFPNIGESDASKADGSSFSAPNSALAAMATKVGDDDSSDDDTDPAAPGSPAWEAVDAQIAHDAALALKTAGELIRKFAQREATEVAVGEGNDIFDTVEAESAMAGVAHALGIMAQMAFHEGLEAAKSLGDEDVVEKAGKRLSTKSVTALAAARDHISTLLGDDDPAKHDKKKTSGKSAAAKFIDSANKALLSKEIDNMTADELIKLLDERDAQKAAEAAEEIVDDEVVVDDETAEKGKSAMDQAEAVSNAKTANSKAKSRKKKVANTDDALEDEAMQGNHDSANNSPSGAAKAADEVEIDDDVELTPEVIEANEAAKAAKKEAKRLRKAAEQAALTAALTKSIEENLTKVVEQNSVLNATVETLREELDGVKKMAAPSDVSRMAPPADLNKSAERDAMDLALAKYERLAKEADDIDYRRECSDRAKALRVRIAEAAKV